MDWKGDAVEAIKVLKDAAPAIAIDIPAIGPFIPLLTIALSAVSTVQHSTGGTTASAVQMVAMHLTPGAPNADALHSSGTPSPEAESQIKAATQAAASGTR